MLFELKLQLNDITQLQKTVSIINETAIRV